MARRQAATVASRETLPIVGASWARHLRAEGKSSQTISTYLKAVHSLSEYLPAGTPAAAVTKDNLVDWLNFLRDERNYQAATLSQRHRSIQQFFRHMVSEGDLDRSPLDGLAPPRIPDAPPPVLTIIQQQALLDAVRGQSFADRRDTAILRLFMSTGIRRGEMSNIAQTDLDLDREIVYVTGKTGSRSVSYGRKATQALDRYVRARAMHRSADTPALWLGERGPLTVYGIEQTVKHAAAVAGLPWVSCHVFRHTWAAAALGAGLHEQDVSTLAGWRAGSQMIARYGRAVRHDRATATHRANNPGDLV